MSSGAPQDGEVSYRFSRRVRVTTAAIGVVLAVAGIIISASLHAWDGVVGSIIAVFGIGGLLAQQLGIRAQLTSRLPQGPLSRLVVSLAVLALVAALVALESGNIVPVMAVSSVLFVLFLIQFWWANRRSSRKVQH